MSAERGRAILAARLGARCGAPSAQAGPPVGLILPAASPTPGPCAVVESSSAGSDALAWGGVVDMRAAVSQQSTELWELVSRMQQLLDARDRSCSEADALRASLEDTERRLADALGAKEGALARLASQEARIDAAAGRAAAAEARSMVLEQDLHTALLDAQARGTELDDARSCLAAAKSDSGELQRQLRDALSHMDAQRVEFETLRLDLDSRAAAAEAQLSGLRAELEASRRCVDEVRHDASLCSDAVDVLSAQCADMQAAYSQAVADAVALQAHLDAAVTARDAALGACAEKDKQCAETEAAVAELRLSVTALQRDVQAAHQDAQQAAAIADEYKRKAEAAVEAAAAADAAAVSAAAAAAAKEGEAHQARNAIERACIERDVAVSEAADAKALRLAADKARDDAVIAVRQLRGEADVLSELTHPQLMAILAAMEAGMGNLRRAALAAEVAARTAAAAAASECAVCLGAARDTALTCGHLCCASCAAKLATCPICRQRVVSRTRVFI